MRHAPRPRTHPGAPVVMEAAMRSLYSATACALQAPRSILGMSAVKEACGAVTNAGACARAWVGAGEERARGRAARWVCTLHR